MNTFQGLEQLSWTKKYISYVIFRKKGIKKTTETELNQFFQDYQKQTIQEKRKFIYIAVQLAFAEDAYSLYLPGNLWKNFMEPDLQNWIIDEPTNSLPYVLSHKFELVKKGLALDSYNQFALNLFGQMVINRISLNQHEIDSGFRYDGNPKEDLELIEFYLNFIDNISNKAIAYNFETRLLELKKCALENCP
jgi:hypothetical protein